MVALLNKFKISFKQAFASVMAVSMLCALVLSWIIMSILSSIQQSNQLDAYSTYDNFSLNEYNYDNQQLENKQQTYDIQELYGTQEENTNIYGLINMWVPLVCFFLSSIFAAFLFYRWKVKTPLSILNNSIRKIEEKELDFSIHYDGKDEMGELIKAFENMRNELHTSFTTQWRAQEDRKLLDAAFAHDIRTPLTVLKGQVDVLLINVTKENANTKKVVNTLNLLVKHIGYLEKYVDHMSTLQRLDEIQISKMNIEWNNFWLPFQKRLEQIAEMEGKKIDFLCNTQKSYVNIDEAIITRILDNIVSNAARYAKSNITVNINIADTMIIEIYDDGPGFSAKALHHGLEPFYHENHRKDRGHSEGLGLFICSTLIKKLYGMIVLSNCSSGGGCVMVKININE